MSWITVREARQQLGNAVGLSTLYRLVSQGKLDGTKIAGRILVSQQSLTDMVSKGRWRVLSPGATDGTDRRRRRSA